MRINPVFSAKSSAAKKRQTIPPSVVPSPEAAKLNLVLGAGIPPIFLTGRPLLSESSFNRYPRIGYGVFPGLNIRVVSPQAES